MQRSSLQCFYLQTCSNSSERSREKRNTLSEVFSKKVIKIIQKPQIRCNLQVAGTQHKDILQNTEINQKIVVWLRSVLIWALSSQVHDKLANQEIFQMTFFKGNMYHGIFRLNKQCCKLTVGAGGAGISFCRFFTLKEKKGQGQMCFSHNITQLNPIFKCYSESQLFYFQPNFLLNAPGKQQVMAKLVASLPATEKARIVSGSCFQWGPGPAVVGIWRMNQQRLKTLSLLSRKYKNI